MPTYVLLCNVTKPGVDALVRDTPADRLDLPAFLADGFSQVGGEVLNAFWTLGPYDVIALARCDSNEQLQAALLGIAALDFVRTTTLTVLNEGPADTALSEAARVSGHLRGGHLRGGEGAAGG